MVGQSTSKVRSSHARQAPSQARMLPVRRPGARRSGRTARRQLSGPAGPRPTVPSAERTLHAIPSFWPVSECSQVSTMPQDAFSLSARYPDTPRERGSSTSVRCSPQSSSSRAFDSASARLEKYHARLSRRRTTIATVPRGDSIHNTKTSSGLIGFTGRCSPGKGR